MPTRGSCHRAPLRRYASAERGLSTIAPEVPYPRAEGADSTRYHPVPELIHIAIKGTQMQIAVIGLGYVGLVTATCLARLGQHVVGLEVDAEKLASLERGEAP
jgi:hypothetical protein